MAHGIMATHVMCCRAARHHARLQGSAKPRQQEHTRQGASKSDFQFAQGLEHGMAWFSFPMNDDYCSDSGSLPPSYKRRQA